MDLRGDDFKRSIRAPAKLNLFLDVLGRRGDGFHDLETLMVPIRLADQVSMLLGLRGDNHRYGCRLRAAKIKPKLGVCGDNLLCFTKPPG